MSSGCGGLEDLCVFAAAEAPGFWTPSKPSPRGSSCSSFLLQFSLSTCQSVCPFSCSVVSGSLRPRGLQHARPPCPSPTPGVYSNSCPLSRLCQLSGDPSPRLLQGASETRASGAALRCLFLRSSGHHDIHSFLSAEEELRASLPRGATSWLVNWRLLGL